MRRIALSLCVLGLIVLGVAWPFLGRGFEPTSEPWQPTPAAAKKQTVAERAACMARFPERQALFGDLHIHTSISMDANASGTLTSPDDAYRYATGEIIEVYSGDPETGMRATQIDRPLDFAAVTDHAEWMAEVSLCTTPGSASYDSTGCKIYRGEDESLLAKTLGLKGFKARIGGLLDLTGRRDDVCGDDDKICRAELGNVWRETQASAERWYDRSPDCSFTTFHAWEYSHSPYSTKVHRNIILRNEISPELPISSLETPVEMDLRQQLVDLCNDTDTGCEAIAIPHNPNLSNGQMFRVEYADLPPKSSGVKPNCAPRLEPIVEMMQIKGESECRNGMYGVVGEPDEFCNFEKVRDFGGQKFEDCEEGAGNGAQAGRGCVSRNDFVRYALLTGMREEKSIGVNPYAFGFIGSTDTHMATPGAVSEFDVPYKFGATPETIVEIGERKRGPAFWNPGGLAGVWAEENTRDSIFDALKRREAFATSGPRIAPRLFGGWNLNASLCQNPQFAIAGYAQGVPMGAELPPRPPNAKSPSFAVSALADPGTDGRPGGLLQQVQIIKGWVDDAGLFHQEVHTIAGDPNNGATVDLDTCMPTAPKPSNLCTLWQGRTIGEKTTAEYSHSIKESNINLDGTLPDHCTPSAPGEGYLCGVWSDPNFDSKQGAVYYARVIENPSCRWSTRLCLGLPKDKRPDGCTSDKLPKTIQERAWTSPIWYLPENAQAAKP